MSHTRTGNFPIGFRRGWSDWQKKDPMPFMHWAHDNGFAHLDLMNVSAADFRLLKQYELGLGSVDLLDFGAIMSTDTGKRKDVIERNVKYVRETVALGARVFFTCVIPGDKTASRADNYRLAVECFSPIGQACKDVGAFMVVEGWPGDAPHFANLCCTPETCRAFLKDVPGSAINYDPSHLIRLGVDHVRFVSEFAPHIRHVHAKDTELIDEARYEFGTQPGAFKDLRPFGEWTWRYCIPGHGSARWNEIFRVLQSAGFTGRVSIELEDENFYKTEQDEKLGLLTSLAFLQGT